MNDCIKKLIIFKEDDGVYYGNKCYVKFLDKEEKLAVFYNPLIAPKYLKSYIKENNIKEAYEVVDYNILKNNKSKVYTFKSNNGVYNVNKGIELIKKHVLLVDSGMSISLPLSVYSYDLYSDYMVIKPYKDGISNKNFCYVAKDDEIDNRLKVVMIPVLECIPGVLVTDNHPLLGNVKKKRHESY